MTPKEYTDNVCHVYGTKVHTRYHKYMYDYYITRMHSINKCVIKHLTKKQTSFIYAYSWVQYGNCRPQKLNALENIWFLHAPSIWFKISQGDLSKSGEIE